MSQNFEDSPVSDNRMDISEATTSQESAGVSPTVDAVVLTENLNTDLRKSTNINDSSFYSNKNCHTTMTTKDYTSLKNMSNDNNIMKLNNIPLDNDPPSILRLGQNLRQQNCNSYRASELTVANSHPLMSPPSTDSDSENGHQRIFNFPDVVPKNEPLRLANPSNRLHENQTRNSTLITKTKVIHQQDLDVTADCTATSKATTAITQTEFSGKRKISVQREPSPDLLSSESDQDLSQYQASVEPNYQSVTLVSNNLSRMLKTPSPRPLTRRKIPITADLLSDDMSSLDSISNHSFDDDMEHNLASLSPSSSVLDGFNDKYDNIPEIETPTNAPPEPIPQYSAEDERRDSRNWQKITLPNGRVREIDMKVIEPYKRVLSHGGYLKAGGHNAIVMFCACHLPDRSRADYHYVMDNLFLYVVKTLEQLVTEDYVLIYLHGGSSRRNVPPFPWLKRCYQLLDRRLRKSLKNLYLVHPSFWLKSVVWMSRPFVSSKFWRKLVYVRSLEELYSMVSVEKAAIPDKVKQYDAKYS